MLFHGPLAPVGEWKQGGMVSYWFPRKQVQHFWPSMLGPGEAGVLQGAAVVSWFALGDGTPRHFGLNV